MEQKYNELLEKERKMKNDFAILDLEYTKTMYSNLKKVSEKYFLR